MGAQPHILSHTAGIETDAAQRDLAWIERAVEQMTWRQRDELARMRRLGLRFAERLELSAEGRLSPEEEAVLARRSKGIIRDFVMVARAIRQIVVLERELAGLRPARRTAKPKAKNKDLADLPTLKKLRGLKPLRSLKSLNLRDDDWYDFRPVGEAVTWIRETLCIDRPPGDPFPAPRDKAASSAPVEQPARPHAGFGAFHAAGTLPAAIMTPDGPWLSLPPRGPP